MRYYERADWASRRLEERDAAVIKMLLNLGFPQHKLAALYDVNGGRIAEIANGHRFPKIEPLDVSTSPSAKFSR